MSKYKKCPVCSKCGEPYIPGNVVCECPEERAKAAIQDRRIELMFAEKNRCEIEAFTKANRRREIRARLEALAEEHGYVHYYYFHNDEETERQTLERLAPHLKYLSMTTATANNKLVSATKELDRMLAEG